MTQIWITEKTEGKHEKLSTLDDLRKYLEIDNKNKVKKKEKEMEEV
jgi:hypothetical protein